MSTEAQGLVEADLSTISDLVGSNQFMLCLQRLCRSFKDCALPLFCLTTSRDQQFSVCAVFSFPLPIHLLFPLLQKYSPCRHVPLSSQLCPLQEAVPVAEGLRPYGPFILFKPQAGGKYSGLGLSVGHPKICHNDILIILNWSCLRIS